MVEPIQTNYGVRLILHFDTKKLALSKLSSNGADEENRTPVVSLEG